MDKKTYMALENDEARAMFCAMRDLVGLTNSDIARDLERSVCNVSLWAVSRKPPIYAFNYLEQMMKAQAARLEMWAKVVTGENAERPVRLTYIQNRRDDDQPYRSMLNRETAAKMRFCQDNGIEWRITTD